MIILNLTANGTEQNLIKQFLQNNVNEFLANKINNGVKIQKDGKTLISKKNLTGFFKYATEEARKLAEKGANSAMVEDKVVFGWAMHYFEEDSIIGTLYNEDGTEYKPVVKKASKPTVAPTTTYAPPVKKTEPQMSMFDLFSSKKEEGLTPPIVENDEPTEEDIQDAFSELQKEEFIEEKPIQPVYKKYLDTQIKHPNHIIAYRLGDFYEVFGDSAIKISNELELTLTGRDFGLKERIPMIGFPYHSSETYFDKIAKNNSIIVIDCDNEYEYKPSVDIPPNIDLETGEILSSDNTFNNDIIKNLQAVFGDLMEIRLWNYAI